MTTISAAARLRSGLRILLAATSACLGLGLVMSFLVTGPVAQVATSMVWTGLALLVIVPILNVVAVFVDEWAAGRRAFAWAAVGVILLLAATTIYRLR